MAKAVKKEIFTEVEKLMNADYRKQETRDAIQAKLKKFKKLKVYDGEVPQEAIEQLIGEMHRKYEITMQWITPCFIRSELDMWSISFKRTDDHSWLGSITAHTMYELLAKSCIKMFDDIRTKQIPEREYKEVEENNGTKEE